MKCVAFALAVSSACGQSAVVGQGGLLHESEMPKQGHWSIKEGLQGSEVHEVIIAVKQLNKEALHSKLMDVSDPKSPNRYSYLSYDESHLLTANPDAAERIRKWLSDEQITVTKQHKHGHFIHAAANISTLERALSTKFAQIASKDAPETLVIRAVKDVSVPSSLADAFDGIFKTTQLPMFSRPGPVVNAAAFAASRRISLSDLVSPDKIAKFYNVNAPSDLSSSTQSVFAEMGQTYSQQDLEKFLEYYQIDSDVSVTQPSSGPSGHGSDDAKCKSSPNDCMEANLDVQQMVGGAPGAPTTFWYTPEDKSAPYESWITAVSADNDPPKVHSISYGSIEEALSKELMETFNTEVMKLGLQGVTVFVSSGDDGVANFWARSYGSRYCGYHPSWPASSPYVTAVGATMGGADYKVTSLAEEEACSVPQGGVTSGGGFSTVFDQADYQKDAIRQYFSRADTPESGYNPTGRGYPDISMAGNMFSVTVGDQWTAVSGTSASSPVVASFATMVNAERGLAGKPPLGFLNPTLYANPDAFNDITAGNNKCTASSSICCSQGFYEAEGWSPITGLGSVDFRKFAAIFDAAQPHSSTLLV